MSITRYKDPIPEGVPIISTLEEAVQLQLTNENCCFYPENNGHYAKILDGTVVGVASDEMIEEIDRREAEWEARYGDIAIEPKNGGYTIQAPNGPIIAYAGDNLIQELDDRKKSLEFYEQLLAEKGISESDVSRVFEAARGCSHPFCVHAGVPGNGKG
ncbi:hypothetical protein BDV25DRAFT_138303 [Aspergillus avenaceus]|uniref:Uncharacterized protein n=1 Tax=Aspergillus avenaceus TaxID=36643 RepID=A0A5N6U103_ASPAV|nr:hypothetical protein BDV25DRAFT_138303 [Aspergillus avenaceus]